MRTFTVFGVVALLAGCASQPAPTSATATTPVIAPGVEAAKMAVLNSSNGAAAVPAAEPVAMTARKPSAPPGYKAVERNGTTLYCTKVATLGTKLKQEICMTQDEYDEVQRRGENVRQDLRQTTKMCGGGTGPFSCSGG